MKKKKSYYSKEWYRSISTTQEKRMWYAHKDQVHIRGRRSPKQIPNDWDDDWPCIQKTWKKKRKTQYRGRSNKTEYVVELPCYISAWDIQQEFNAGDIPYRLDEIRTTYSEWVYPHKRVHTFRECSWGKTIYQGKKGWWSLRYVPDTSKPKVERFWCSTDYYILTYWHHTKLNLDYLCCLT